MTATPSLDSLNAIVQEHSRQFVALHDEVAAVGNKVAALFGQLSDKMDGQRNEIYADQRRANEQQVALLAGNKPDYRGLVVAVATVAAVFITVFVTIGSMAINPLKESELDLKSALEKIVDLQQRRNLALEASVNGVEKDVTDARLALATLAGTSSERHEEYLRDHAALATRIDAVDGALIKRPEIEALNKGLGDQIVASSGSANERINSVILSLNELRHDVGANYTLGDGLKGALDRIDKMQQEINLLAQMPSRETSPAPAAPPH